MDHMLELARHPDLLEALQNLEKDPKMSEESRERARDLQKLGFLASEHPNTWVVEAVHRFYAKPAFASDVWVELRYCKTFRRELARREEAERSWWTKARQPGSERTKAIHRRTTELAEDRAGVERLCKESKTHPDPPAFLIDLMSAQRLPEDQWDVRTQELLTNRALVKQVATEHKVPVPFSLVQEEELRQIAQTRADLRSPGGRLPDDPSPPDRHSARVALDRDLVGLAFSGGGIRSATFNLGVLQGLSKIGMLGHFDYLSTVSGGGYIGAWLSGWIRRELDTRAQLTPTVEPPPDLGSQVVSDIQRSLSPTRSPNPMEARVRPIRFLREYSNYLTPRAGFLSADTWTMIGIYVRNTLLNQVILVALFAAVLLMPRLWFSGTKWMSPQWWPVWLAAALWVLGACFLILNLRRLDPPGAEGLDGTAATPAAIGRRPPWYGRPRVIHGLVVVPWLLACALIARPLGEWALWGGGLFSGCALAPGDSVAHQACTEPIIDGRNILGVAGWTGVMLAISFGVLLFGGGAYRCWGGRRYGQVRAAVPIIFSAVLGGVVGGGLTWVLLRALLLRSEARSVELTWHLNGILVPGLLSVLSLSIVALLGMLGVRFPDEHREWWSRLRTVLHIYAVAWLALFASAVYLPWARYALAGSELGLTSGFTALATWLGATILGVKQGPKAEEDRKKQSEVKGPASLASMVLRFATVLAPYAFIVGLLVAVSLGVDALYLRNAPPDIRDALTQDAPGTYWNFATWTADHCMWWIAGCALVGFTFSWRVNINEFSIHHFYKNRLVRCYLGASHTTERKPDWLTGFDPKDDLPLRVFDHVWAAETDRPRHPGPYPVVNCALNLVGGQDLAWQERKATSFVFTPKYCGYDVDRAVLTKHFRDQSSEAYVPTRAFYRVDQGPSLGMAMAISGAAANPNMGRASTPALAVLMTVFNVRLGWWIGNPRRRGTAIRPGPPIGLPYTLAELFGATNDTGSYVNISDGGHFDNLGVYELIRRSCRYIVVCDAGQDSRFTCEALGDLVRRCRTDFGVEIDIAIDRIRERDAAGLSRAHCVVGKVHYLNLPKRDGEQLVAEGGGPVHSGCRPAHEVGYLIYLKPCMTGDEPQDVLEYNRRVPEFPHESTADQWFDESQFESYRKLGMHIAEATFSRYQSDDTQAIGDLGPLFERLYRYWYPPAVAIGPNASEHAKEYSRIMEMVRTQPGLQGLDHVLFGGLPAGSAASPRDRFYVCNALIQLTENVYADLDLEGNWDHPLVGGWMEVFKRWARTPEFRDTWKISQCTYAERFRNFYNDRLAEPLATHEVPVEAPAAIAHQGAPAK